MNADFQKMVNKRLKHPAESQRQSSKLSQKSGTQPTPTRQVFSKRGSISHEAFKHTDEKDVLTPRVIEPKGDNADLRMISENRDTEGNEFGSKIVQ